MAYLNRALIEAESRVGLRIDTTG